jgi:hypothetical protein
MSNNIKKREIEKRIRIEVKEKRLVGRPRKYILNGNW